MLNELIVKGFQIVFHWFIGENTPPEKHINEPRSLERVRHVNELQEGGNSKRRRLECKVLEFLNLNLNEADVADAKKLLETVRLKPEFVIERCNLCFTSKSLLCLQVRALFSQ